MENTIEKVRSFLINSIDEKYRSFNQSLVPGESSGNVGSTHSAASRDCKKNCT